MHALLRLDVDGMIVAPDPGRQSGTSVESSMVATALPAHTEQPVSNSEAGLHSVAIKHDRLILISNFFKVNYMT
jgi:hypothetical protein